MKTVDEIYGQMVSTFADKTGVEPAGSGDLAVRFYAVAAEVYSLYVQADWILKQCFPQTAQGEFLDRYATLRGIERKQAEKAQGSLRFAVDSPVDTDLTIPAGSVCMTAGLLRFETMEDALIPAGETYADVPAHAVDPGTAGNVPGGSILTMAVAPTGVSRCTNPLPFAGGTDREEDETLRARVMETYQRLPNGANAAFYQQTALAFPQVAAAQVLPRSRGIGTVDVVIAAQGGIPDETLIRQVWESLQSKREIAVDVGVLPPETVTVDLSVEIRTCEGKDPNQVRTAVETALQSFFDGRLLGEDLLLARLGQIVFAVDGVENYRISAPAADLSVEPHQLPVLGSLSVEEMA